MGDDKMTYILKNSEQNLILVKLEKDDYISTNNLHYFGVTYNKRYSTWVAQRRSKYKKTMVYNGCYKDEEEAARASDTLATKLMANGEKGHNLNYPDDNIEVWAKNRTNYIGVNFQKRDLTWRVHRWSKNEKKTVHNGIFKNEEKAAHASDTLARKLIANGEKGHKLNFPDNNDTEVYAKKRSNYIGLSYNARKEIW